MRRSPGDVVLGRYQLGESLGRGASGQVFRATDLLLDEVVALKLFYDAIESFEVARREVRLARRVTHANVARVFDLGLEGKHVFVTMELVSGEPLSAALARAKSSGSLVDRLPLGVALRTMLDVSRGLVAVHAAGVVHRDIKPANVLVTPTRALLTDFGIALPASDGELHDDSGTPAYMAPEQILGQAIDSRTDVYALGLVLYQLLTGYRAHEDRGQIIPVRRLTEPSPNPRTLTPSLPAELSRLVERMLAVDPLRRPNAVVVLKMLEDLRGGGVVSVVRSSPGKATDDVPARAPEDQRAIEQATTLLERFVLDATREAVVVLEARAESQCVEVSALLARALLRMWIQIGGQDDALLLRAEEMALRALSEDPTNTTVHLTLATVQHELGSYRASLRAARKLLAKNPELAEAHAVAGRACFELGSLEEALAHLDEAVRLAPETVEPWLDRVRLRALAMLNPEVFWSEIDALSERFGRRTTASLRVRFSFVYRDVIRALEVAREISEARTGAAWEATLPELEVLAGIREKTPVIVTGIVERTRNRRPPAHRERVYHEIMIERLVALDELALAHDWLEHDGVILGPVWLDRCPSLEPVRGESRFHGAQAMHHVSIGHAPHER